ncbi:MAG TPA: hypothetical protein VJP80_04315 [Candidatus Saccharimonadales bacterium]|nr:hypothetical protein [Candidatus Saccharimonadales bacterium]
MGRNRASDFGGMIPDFNPRSEHTGSEYREFSGYPYQGDVVDEPLTRGAVYDEYMLRETANLTEVDTVSDAPVQTFMPEGSFSGTDFRSMFFSDFTEATRVTDAPSEVPPTSDYTKITDQPRTNGEIPAAPIEASEVAASVEPQRVRPTRRLVSVQGPPEEKVAASGRLGDRPQPGRVINEAKRGGRQQLVVTRLQDGGEVTFEITPSLVPANGELEQSKPKSRRAPVEAPKETPKITPELAATYAAASVETAPNPNDIFTAHVRIVSGINAPLDLEGNGNANGKSRPDEGADQGMEIAELFEQYTGPFRLTVEADGLPDLTRRDLYSAIDVEWRDAKNRPGDDENARLFNVIRNRLAEAAGTALVRTGIVLSTPGKHVPEQVAEDVAGAVFHSSGEVAYGVESDAATSEAVVYDSIEAALEAARSDLTSLMPADMFADSIRYPQKEVRGLHVNDGYIFAVNRRIREGTHTVEIGQIVDNQGHVGGDKFPIPYKDLKRHTLVVASSGAGKTELLRQLVLSMMVSDKALIEKGEGNHVAHVIVDFEKTGNYSEKLQEMLNASDLPEEQKQINVVRPGGDGLWANINLFRPTGGKSPVDQLTSAVDALSSKITDPDAQRTFAKFLSAAGQLAFEELGWNMVTGKPKYPNGTPGIPDSDLLALCIERVINSQGFQGTTQSDLGAFTLSTFTDTLRGAPGQLFTYGYDLDARKICDAKGVTVIELGHIDDAEVKQTALTALLRALGDAVTELKPGSGDTDDTYLRLILDEAGQIFNKNTPAGKKNAHWWTFMRGMGIAATIAQQGNLDEIDPSVLTNTVNVLALQINEDSDRTIVANQAGLKDAEKLRYLASTDPGGGVAYGSAMKNGPIRFCTTAPSDLHRIPGGEENIHGPDALLDRGVDREGYTGHTKINAREWLAKDPLGTQVMAWAEKSAILLATGHMPERLSGELKKRISAVARDGHRSSMLDAAICLAAGQATRSRSVVQWATSYKGFAGGLIEHMVSDVHDRPLLEMPRLDLAFDFERYNAVLDELVEVGNMTAPPNTDPKYAEALGQEVEIDGEKRKRIAGSSAEEQKNLLVALESNTVKDLAIRLRNSSQRTAPDPRTAQLLQQQFQEIYNSEVRQLLFPGADQIVTQHMQRFEDPNPEARSAVRQGVRKQVETQILAAQAAERDTIVAERMEQYAHLGENARAMVERTVRENLEGEIAAAIQTKQQEIATSIQKLQETAMGHIGSMSVGDYETSLQNIAKLVGTSGLGKALSILQPELEAMLGGPLSEAEHTRLVRLAQTVTDISKRPPLLPVDAAKIKSITEASIPALNEELDASIKLQRETAPAVDLSAYEQHYRQFFEDDTIDFLTGTATTAKQQYDHIQELAKAAARRSTYKQDVNMTDVYFAPSHSKNGFTVDILTQRMLDETGREQGKVFDEQEALYAGGNVKDPSYIKQLALGDARATLWGSTLADNFLFNDNFSTSYGAQQSLARGYSDVAGKLNKEAARRREVEQRLRDRAARMNALANAQAARAAGGK